MASLPMMIQCRLTVSATWLSQLARREGLGRIGPYIARAVHNPGQWGSGRGGAKRLLSDQCSAALSLSALSRRWTIECLVPNSSGYFSLSRLTMASDVSCDCAASHPRSVQYAGSAWTACEL